MPYIYTFLLRFGGGPKAANFWETEHWVKSNCPSGKVLGASFWDQLSHEHGTSAALSKLRHAVLRLAYTGSLDEVKVSVNDVKKILGSGMKYKSEAADDFMGFVRSLCSTATVPAELWTHILEFEMTCVEILLERRAVKHIPTMKHAAKLLVDKLVGFGAPVLTTQWDKFVVKEQAVARHGDLQEPQLLERVSKVLCWLPCWAVGLAWV